MSKILNYNKVYFLKYKRYYNTTKVFINLYQKNSLIINSLKGTKNIMLKAEKMFNYVRLCVCSPSTWPRNL